MRSIGYALCVNRATGESVLSCVLWTVCRARRLASGNMMVKSSHVSTAWSFTCSEPMQKYVCSAYETAQDNTTGVHQTLLAEGQSISKPEWDERLA